jgi:hypothetical protein
MGIERGCEKGAHGNGAPAANQTRERGAGLPATRRGEGCERRQAPFIAT